MAYAQKSLSITALDALPPKAPNPTGDGAQGYEKNTSDWILPTTGELGATTTKYNLIRVPTNIKLKALTLAVDGALDSSTGLALDVGAYYSDATDDGTPASLQGTVISANCFLAASTAFRSSAVAEVNALLAYSVANRNLPLWQGLGLAADPGGNIDIVVAVHTDATTAVSSKLGIQARFVE